MQKKLIYPFCKVSVPFYYFYIPNNQLFNICKDEKMKKNFFLLNFVLSLQRFLQKKCLNFYKKNF